MEELAREAPDRVRAFPRGDDEEGTPGGAEAGPGERGDGGDLDGVFVSPGASPSTPRSASNPTTGPASSDCSATAPGRRSRLTA